MLSDSRTGGVLVVSLQGVGDKPMQCTVRLQAEPLWERTGTFRNEES